MPKNPADETAPTMIIPKGTEIQVDRHGQLSVRAPGNLVVQNSGNYGNLESVAGSIRVEPGVEVEAVSVKCAETCYVQGNLTAWKVNARTLQLEDTARAHIVLQETEKLEIGKGARLVGNFGSEKELFFLFSRFSQQVRTLPYYQQQEDPALPETAPVPGAGVKEPAALKGSTAGASPEAALKALMESHQRQARAEGAVPGSGPLSEEEMASDSLALLAASDPTITQELPDALFFALVLLERDAVKNERDGDSARVLSELVKLLRERDLETLQHTYHTLFGRIPDAGKMLHRAEELIESFFSSSAPAAGGSPEETEEAEPATV